MPRGRPKKMPETITEEELSDPMTKTLEENTPKKMPIEEMPLNSIRDYRLYNEEARKQNKKLGMCRYKIKPCPVELHPKTRVKFSRNDQPSNPLNVYVSNDIIDYKETLYPGKVYDLPDYIVHYLSNKGYPVWRWYDNPDGSRETGVSHYTPRFSLNTIYQG